MKKKIVKIFINLKFHSELSGATSSSWKSVRKKLLQERNLIRGKFMTSFKGKIKDPFYISPEKNGLNRPKMIKY